MYIFQLFYIYMFLMARSSNNQLLILVYVPMALICAPASMTTGCSQKIIKTNAEEVTDQADVR